MYVHLGFANNKVFVNDLARKRSSVAWQCEGCRKQKINFDTSRNVEDNAKQALPTMHEELHELRRALRLQEDMHARTRSELEAARLAPQNIFQQASSIPISSRTTESGWECVSRDRVQAFPVRTEVRSPEILTPSHRSPANREKFDFAEATQGVPSSVVEAAAPVRLALRAGEQAPLRFAQRASSSSSSERTHRSRTTPELYVIGNSMSCLAHWK